MSISPKDKQERNRSVISALLNHDPVQEKPPRKNASNKVLKSFRIDIDLFADFEVVCKYYDTNFTAMISKLMDKEIESLAQKLREKDNEEKSEVNSDLPNNPAQQ